MSTGSCLNHDTCMLVKRCLLNEFNLDTFNNYFEIFDHKMNTRNNNQFINCFRLNLSLLIKPFFTGGILYNSLLLELRQVDDILLFKKETERAFQIGSLLEVFFTLSLNYYLSLPVLWFKWILTSSKLVSLLDMLMNINHFLKELAKILRNVSRKEMIKNKRGLKFYEMIRPLTPFVRTGCFKLELLSPK